MFGVWLATRGDDAPAATGWEGAIRPPGTRLPDFSLRNQDGDTVTAAALRGRPAVVTFIYSTCEDTCPGQVQSIRGALDDLGRDVPVIGVSVDPANDTRETARAFLLEQSMTGRMDFLLGSREQLEPVWKAFGIAPQRDGPRPLGLHRAGRRRGPPADRLPGLGAHAAAPRARPRPPVSATALPGLFDELSFGGDVAPLPEGRRSPPSSATAPPAGGARTSWRRRARARRWSAWSWCGGSAAARWC